MDKILYLRDVQRVIRDYFIECIEQGVYEVEVTEANSDLCSRMEGVAFVSQYGLPGDPVWFLLQDGCEWFISKESVAGIGKNGFWVPGKTGENWEPKDVTYFSYDEVGMVAFFSEEEALAALKAKEAKEVADQCQN